MLYTVLIKLKAYIMIYTAISIGLSYGNNIITTRERDLTSRNYYNKSNGRQNYGVYICIGNVEDCSNIPCRVVLQNNVCLFFYFFW